MPAFYLIPVGKKACTLYLALPYAIGTSEEFMLVIVGYLILIAAIMGGFIGGGGPYAPT